MAKIQPLNQESRFEPHELFFSRTDKRGVIQSGNAVFVRVSQHSEEALFGAPHNLIRHPDMPKAVFRLFWDMIQANRPIGAYVKNMSKDGSYYWVFAAVWPIENGYLSLRLKPMSPLLEKVKGLYSAVLAKEKASGMEAGHTFLLDSIRELGFETYGDFMSTALVTELQKRDQVIGAPAAPLASLSDKDLTDTYRRICRAGGDYGELFKTLVSFLEGTAAIKASSAKILGSFKQLGFISVNMAIDAERAEERGRAVAEVSSGFNKIANEIRAGIAGFQESQEKTLKAITASQFELGGARLQAEITRVFLEENRDGQTHANPQKHADFMQNLAQLTQLAGESSRRVSENLQTVRNTLQAFISRANELRSTIAGLEVIRLSGKIEISKLDAQSSQSFTNHIARMDEFIRNVSLAMSEILTAGTALVHRLDSSLTQLDRVITLLSQRAS